MASESTTPLVAVVMGSKSDWDTMSHADATLMEFGVAHECHVMSAHRTPQLATEFASGAADRGIQIIIAAAGGAAHLAGVIAAHTTLPVLGVPMKSEALNGMDSLLSTVQMPAGIPVATFAIGEAGAAAEEERRLLAADRDHRDDRDLLSQRQPDEPLAAAEVDLGRLPAGTVHLVIAAGIDQHRSTRVVCTTHRSHRLHGATTMSQFTAISLDELTQAAERKGFLDEQSADLNEAIETLEDAIRRIDRERAWAALARDRQECGARCIGKEFAFHVMPSLCHR